MDVQQLLADAPGQWEGEYKLWFKPSDAPDAHSPSHATVTSEMQGGGLLLRYDWSFGEDAHEGLAIIVPSDDGGMQMGWGDTMHSSHGVMHNEAVGDAAVVIAHYGPEAAPWGWRTEFEMPSRDELQIRAWNIIPDRPEALATEALYTRVR